jgi:hypothetical protein
MQNIDRPIRTTSSQVVATFAMLFTLGFAVLCSIMIKDGIKSGRVWSPTFSSLPTHLVYADKTPHAFWSFVVLYSVINSVMYILPVFGFREVFNEHKRKVAAKNGNADAMKK